MCDRFTLANFLRVQAAGLETDMITVDDVPGEIVQFIEACHAQEAVHAANIEAARVAAEVQDIADVLYAEDIAEMADQKAERREEMRRQILHREAAERAERDRILVAQARIERRRVRLLQDDELRLQEMAEQEARDLEIARRLAEQERQDQEYARCLAAHEVRVLVPDGGVRPVEQQQLPHPGPAPARVAFLRPRMGGQ